MAGFDGREYQSRFDALAADGVDVHGEAGLVRFYSPASVLDAGCGTGRVAIELARHGISVVGVDVDGSMIAEARRRNPQLEWVEADVSRLQLGRRFQVVVMAGNVPLFCPADRRAALVTSCARHVEPEGQLISGFQLGRGYDLADYDDACAAAGLSLVDRWSTWDRQPFGGTSAGAAPRPSLAVTDADYAVSVHRPISGVGPVGGQPANFAPGTTQHQAGQEWGPQCEEWQVGSW